MVGIFAFFGIIYFIYKYIQYCNETEWMKQQAKQNGWTSYSDASGRSRDMQTGQICTDRYNYQTHKWERYVYNGKDYVKK